MSPLGRFLLWGSSLFSGRGTNTIAAAQRASEFWSPHLGGYPGGNFYPAAPNVSGRPLTAAGGAVASYSIAGRLSPGLQSLGPAMCVASQPGPIMSGVPTWMRGSGNYLTPTYVRPYSQPSRVGSPSMGLPTISSSQAAISILYPGA